MNKKTNLLLGLVVALLAIVGIFVLFSTAFGGDGDNSSVRGSVFYVMLGDSERGYASVGGLISAFALLIVGTVSAIIGGCFKGKLASLVFLFTAVVLAISGVLFAMGPSLYMSANAGTINPDMLDTPITLGTGLICAMVFSFAPAVLALYGAYSTFKE